MGNLYNILKALCDDAGISGYKMCKDCGIQPSLMTDLKMQRRFGLKAETATKVASYFNVPINFLTEQAPFDMWKRIDEDRDGFMHELFRHWERPVEEIQALFNVNPENPQSAALSDFVRFVDATVEAVKLTPDGDWWLTTKDICRKKKDLTQEGKVSSEVSENAIKFALFGGGPVTDAQFAEVKQFAQFIKERDKKNGNKGENT